jgi:hypothetical protein
VSHVINNLTHTCLVIGLLAIAGCTSPQATSSAARSDVDSPLLTGRWGQIDTSGEFTFAADGSFRMRSFPGSPTRTGRYTVLSPEVVILTFPPVVSDAGPQQIKYYYLIQKDGTRSLTDNFLLFDSFRKRQ